MIRCRLCMFLRAIMAVAKAQFANRSNSLPAWVELIEQKYAEIK